MLGITPFGLFHTAISLVSLFTGLYLLVRYREIAWSGPGGRLYVWATVATCVTGLFIFRHGGFNEAHALSILTLLVLAGATWAERGAARGSLRHIAAVLGFTLTVFFHFIPAFNETLVRVPVGSPYITGPDDPKLLPLVGGAFAVFFVVMVLQFLRFRRERGAPMATAAR
jgi:uncharacterized membrane protein